MESQDAYLNFHAKIEFPDFILTKTVLYLYILRLLSMIEEQVYIVDELKQKVHLLLDRLNKQKKLYSDLEGDKNDLEKRLLQQLLC